MSGWYGVLAWPFERAAQNRALRLLAVKETDIALEVGSGPGHTLVQVARIMGTRGRVVGIDISKGMLRTARGRLVREKLLSRAHLTRGDAVRLPFKEDSFDAAYLGFTLELFDTSEMPLVLAELRRVIRPGGRFAVVGMTRSEGASRMLRLYEWLHIAWPRVIDCRPIHVRRTIEQAGFTAMTAETRHICGLPVEIVVATPY
ncbi:MAG: methyltransferase domain-containing protein [Dehalococcoidia bacterium]|nr:MAG: methyltransferase domain-containing protein [Dehalococcoidia bacterium]